MQNVYFSINDKRNLELTTPEPIHKSLKKVTIVGNFYKEQRIKAKLTIPEAAKILGYSNFNKVDMINLLESYKTG